MGMSCLKSLNQFASPILIWLPNTDYKSTMLQKLSKCEVKAWLCWNLIILLPLWFYVKSNFGEFKWSKNIIFSNFRGSEFSFCYIWASFKSQIYQKFKLQSIQNCQKWHFLDRLNSPKFNSRKFWVEMKYSNFNIVKP